MARHIDRSFSLRAWGQGVAAGGPLGELVMRALKRDAGLRFWVNTCSVAGAVGLLDRVAPRCFVAPVYFRSVRWYFQLRPGAPGQGGDPRWAT